VLSIVDQPKKLAVSEFFGHVKGSFTGAIHDKVSLKRLIMETIF
jgi:DNA-binding NtrC family response regulator